MLSIMISSASDKKIDELWSTNREQSEKMKKVEKGREKWMLWQQSQRIM